MLVSAIYPANDKSIPQDTPDNVRHYFHQALLNMRANPSTYDAAVAMFRTSLEVACRDELGAKGKRLVDMIDDLASSGKITSDMKEWAHALRLGGNVPAHGEKPVTAQEAEDLQKFCEAFMMYAFTLPAMVASRKAQTP